MVAPAQTIISVLLIPDFPKFSFTGLDITSQEDKIFKGSWQEGTENKSEKGEEFFE